MLKTTPTVASNTIGADSVKGGAVIEFTSQGAFVFQAKRCLVKEISDRVTLEQDLVSAYQTGSWDDSFVVIDSVVHVGEMAAVISNSKNARLELSAEGGIGTGAMPLADAKAKFTILQQMGEIAHFIGAEELTPLFGLSRLKRSWLDRLRDTSRLESVKRVSPDHSQDQGNGKTDSIIERVTMNLRETA
ncbi:hypothetical protein [Planctomycetes bacterium Pan216]|uniref:hypothetical protein n=1 Tax=Kolteria novifilia TaxID=2527975 RepID=UPI0011A26503